jgi:hypothetical protein
VLQRPFKAEDQGPQSGVIFSQDAHHLFGLGGLRKSRKSPQVAENDGDLSPVALQEFLSS